MEIKKLPYNKINKMLDSFMGHARDDKYWKVLSKLSRKDQLKSMIKVIRGSVIRRNPEVLKYSIKYVQKNW